MTQTLWEKENVDKVDDPDVFQFSMAEVKIIGINDVLGVTEREELATEEAT